MRTLVAMALAMSLGAVELVSWDEGLAAMRSGTQEAYAVVITHRGSRLEGVIRQMQSTTPVQWIQLDAEGEVTNPYSNRPVSAASLIMNLTGPLSELTGGSVLFFDRNGILLPNLTIIQNFHRLRPDVLELYARFAISELREHISIAEFASLEGFKDLGKQLVLEVERKDHRNFGRFFVQMPIDTPFLKGVLADGTTANPLTDPYITIVTRDPEGPVFLAQVRELWTKLNSSFQEGRDNRPPLLVIGPAGANYRTLKAMGISVVEGVATREQLEAQDSPIIVTPGNDGQPAMIFRGFQQGQTVAGYILPERLHHLIVDHRMLYPAIALGDLDAEAEHD